MDYMNYFKLQAKNFQRDFKTQFETEDGIYDYHPHFFKDINEIILAYEVNEEYLPLGHIQHLISILAGFYSWKDILNTVENGNTARLELGKLLLDNRSIFDGTKEVSTLDAWETYLQYSGLNILNVDDSTKLEVFKQVFLNQESK